MSFLINPFGFGGGASPSAHVMVFFASAEHESTPDGLKGFSATGVTIDSGVTGAHGRVYNTNSGTLTRQLSAAQTTLGARCRFRSRTAVNAGELIGFYDIAASNQCRVFVNADGSFEVRRAATAIGGPSSTGLITADTWFWMEFIANIADSGSFTAKLYDDSGTVLATLSGSADTQATANTGADRVTFGTTATDGYYIDNPSIDTAGSILGRCRVECLYPTAAGDLTQWPTRGGTDTGANFSQVNETVQDTVSDVRSNADNQRDSYTTGDRVISGTPLAVQPWFIGARITGGETPAQVQLFLRDTGVNYDGALTHNMTGTSTSGFGEVWNNDPVTGNSWTDAGVNSKQVGMQNLTDLVRCHQLVLEVLVQL